MFKNVYIDERAPLVALLVAITKDFGPECYKDEAELLRQDIEHKYDIELSDLQADKIQAAMLILTTDHFESQWKVFESVCHLANSQHDSLDELNPLESEELIIGLVEANLIKHEVIHYDDDVNLYAGKVFYDYGFSKAPKLFPTAIMPHNTNESDDTEKNSAISELFDARTDIVLQYVNKLPKS